MQDIRYTTGDATKPTVAGNKIIVHICNDIGGWGRGFVLALSKRWKEPEKQYRAWFASQENFALGEVQFVQVEPDMWVANMIGQHNIIHSEQGNPPIRYAAVKSALEKVGNFAAQHRASVHMPRIGCGLAGGTWENIEPLVVDAISQRDIPVTVYDL